ncbi:DUF6090 family protein [Robiginitalea aurantiaca]|uniref:DUF6090 family protein n=1 Tax=Robiginitalea aurantiaca TaxID=3056915 RepID=A0ABT7WDJ9_9FLAO|nr:DUF6090 family protein [Robiginitalea aurantiaca]MDM9630988.1 DUF6090 family protein [Robiginitalea aurantiaca]
MIKFFRKIRQRLLSENKFSRYLIYAIGEIVLVVIGILIALQINTWNKNKQLRLSELETLSEIQVALNQDVSVLSTNLKNLETKILHSREVIMHIENKLPYDKKLDGLFMDVYYHRGYKTFNNSGFELLKERGFDIIQNTDLRKRITKHYTTDLSDINGILTRIEQLGLIQADNLYDNFKLTKNPEGSGGIMTAYDYNQLINDPKVLGPFYHLELLNLTYERNLMGFKEKTEEVLKMVDTELAERKK